MKLKKILLSGLSLVLVAALAIGGTVAFLKDDDSDVNVMTLGNVSIAQHEYERATKADGSYKTTTVDGVTSYELQDFTQGKPLLPIVGDPNEPGNSDAYAGWDSIPVRMSQKNSYGGMKVFAGKNAQDKFVTVENTGKTDAYVRTIIAIEIGSTNGALIGQSYQDSAWTRTAVDNIVIDGNTYRVFEYNYPGALLSDGTYRHENGILPAGDTTYPNLAQVYLKHNATNEDMEAIDGNNNDTIDILVLSQAVQAAGFSDAKTALDAAFGETNAVNAAAWFGGVIADAATGKSVATADELAEALAAGEAVVLTDDITLAAPLTVEKAVNIDLKNHYIASVGLELKNGGSIKNGAIKSACNTEDFLMHFLVSGGTLTMDNVEVDVADSMYASTDYNGSSQACGIRVENAEVILNDCDIKVHNDTNNVYFVQAWAVDVLDAKFTMNGGSITAKCEKGKADDSVTGLDDPAFACALSADGVSTVTFNDVKVEATYFGEVFDWQNYSSTLTFNTTDKNITADDFILWWSAKLTVNHID